MYLHAKKYVEKVNWKMVDHENNVGYDSPEVVYPLFNQIVELAEMQDVATDIYGAEAILNKGNKSIQQDKLDSYYSYRSIGVYFITTEILSNV